MIKNLIKLHNMGLQIMDVIILDAIEANDKLTKADIMDIIFGDRNYSNSLMDKPIDRLYSASLIRIHSAQGRKMFYCATAKAKRICKKLNH